MKKILFPVFGVVFVFLSVSGIAEFSRMLSGFSIESKIELFFMIGFVAYLIVHMVFYKPVFIHVMAHELTHALWAFLFGGKTKKLEVSSGGGRVLISKTNFLITLAPYFFPLYTFLFSIVFAIAQDRYRPYVAFFVGASLSFHIALTLYSLRSSQSDLREDSDIFFSLSFVTFMNLVVLAMILSLISDKISFGDFMKEMFTGTVRITAGFFGWINRVIS